MRIQGRGFNPGMGARVSGRAPWRKWHLNWILRERERDLFNSTCSLGGVHRQGMCQERSRGWRGPGVFWEQQWVEQSWSRVREVGKGSERRLWRRELETDPECEGEPQEGSKQVREPCSDLCFGKMNLEAAWEQITEQQEGRWETH